jgi:hypothetical protein
LARNIYRTGERLEKRLHNVMGFFPIQQFQMEIAPRFICKSLEKLTRQPEPKRRGRILRFFIRCYFHVRFFFQTAPDQVWTSAKIDHASREAFVHGYIRLTRQRIARVEAGSVSADAFFFTERLRDSRAQDQSAIFDGVMRIDFQVAPAAQTQVHHRMFGEEHKHVVQERNAGLHRGFAGAVQIYSQYYLSFTRRAPKGRLTFFHSRIKGAIESKTKRKKGKTQKRFKTDNTANGAITPRDPFASCGFFAGKSLPR